MSDIVTTNNYSSFGKHIFYRIQKSVRLYSILVLAKYQHLLVQFVGFFQNILREIVWLIYSKYVYNGKQCTFVFYDMAAKIATCISVVVVVLSSILSVLNVKYHHEYTV